MLDADEEETGKAEVAKEIEFWGFKFHFVPEYDISKINKSLRTQVRDSQNIAPKQTVDQFAAMMEHKRFDPIVVTQDNGTVDGNTRTDARRQRKDKFCTAFVIEENLTNAHERVRSRLNALAAALNQRGGVRLTHKEAVRAAENMLRLGFKSEVIQSRIGVNSQIMVQIKREITAGAKLEKVGLGNIDISKSALRALGSEKVAAINEAPYRELAKLAVDARFSAAEINETARHIISLSSDTKALDWLVEVRDASLARIGEVSTTGNPGTVTAARALRQHLGYVLKFAGREDELIETSPSQRAAHLTYATKARDVLNALSMKLDAA